MHFFIKMFCQFKETTYLCTAKTEQHRLSTGIKAEGKVPSSIG